MTTAAAPAEQRFLLDAVDWDAYEAFLRGLDDRHVFLTYDRGRMELMSPSWEHDTAAEMIGVIIRVVAEETNLPIRGSGSTTFKRQDLDRGLEPDRCFYIANEARVRGKRTIDLQRDPPPDLAIEIEMSHRLLDRIDIYAALGVNELWRYDGKRLTIHVLQPSGSYSSVSQSPVFPRLSPEQIVQFIQHGRDIDETTWIRSVREWVRDHMI